MLEVTRKERRKIWILEKHWVFDGIRGGLRETKGILPEIEGRKVQGLSKTHMV